MSANSKGYGQTALMLCDKYPLLMCWLKEVQYAAEDLPWNGQQKTFVGWRRRGLKLSLLLGRNLAPNLLELQMV